MKEIKVGSGMYVKYAYRLTDADSGKELFATPEGEPDEMVYGVSQEVVPGLVAALKDLGKGDRFEVTLPPEAAFGPRLAGNVIDLEKEIFMRDGRLAEEVMEGAELPMMTAEGYRVSGKVLEIGDKVKMDFNHPFAGLTVTFAGVVEEVREATPEELHPAHGGCCGCHGSCGDGCGNSGCCDNGGC